jgi:hypothetical protein
LILAAGDLRQRLLHGPRRNRLFMAASQSLYAVYVETTARTLREQRN